MLSHSMCEKCYHILCVKNVQIRRFFWSVFAHFSRSIRNVNLTLYWCIPSRTLELFSFNHKIWTVIIFLDLCLTRSIFCHELLNNLWFFFLLEQFLLLFKSSFVIPVKPIGLSKILYEIQERIQNPIKHL